MTRKPTAVASAAVIGILGGGWSSVAQVLVPTPADPPPQLWAPDTVRGGIYAPMPLSNLPVIQETPDPAPPRPPGTPGVACILAITDALPGGCVVTIPPPPAPGSIHLQGGPHAIPEGTTDPARLDARPEVRGLTTARERANAGDAAARNVTLPQVDIHDCDTQGGYRVSTFLNPERDEAETIVLGIYTTKAGLASDAEGRATVTVRRTEPFVLVLSSYDRTVWQIDAVPDTRIELIVLNGYNEQRIEGVPPGVDVLNRTRGRSMVATLYKWPGDRNEAQDMVDGLHRLLFRRITLFAGCYDASTFSIEDGPEDRR